MDILKKLILIEADKLDKLRKFEYEITYTNEYYLDMILYLLNDVNNWKFLTKIEGYGFNLEKKNIPKYHYKTIYNKYVYWIKKDIFKKAFYNYFYKKNTNLLLLDATSIVNKYGYENITVNQEYKKKKITKLSVLTNKKGFIYSILPFKINKEKGKHSTSVHDIKMIDEHIKDINNNNNIKNNSKYFHQICDKAYKCKNTLNKQYLNKNINTITPDKKNTINKNDKYKNNKLKNRITIEHVNLNLKRYERVLLRKDRKLNTFMGWIYIASLINNIQINNKI